MTARARDRLTHLASRLPSPYHAFRRKTPDRRARRKFARRWIAGFFSVCRLFLVRRLPRAGRTSIQLSVLLPMARDAPHAGKPVCTNFVLVAALHVHAVHALGVDIPPRGPAVLRMTVAAARMGKHLVGAQKQFIA